MIPYFEWHTIQLGPLNLQVWGIFVALGFLFGAYMAGRRANSLGLNSAIIYDLVAWMMLGGIVGGRIGYLFFYNATDFLQNPLSAFSVWDGGLSFMGGLVACVLIGIWYLKKRQVDVWQYADVAIFGLPFGDWVGRIGCFLIHDHPGTATDFFLGVDYPDGITRHDHGLYLSLNGLIMGAAFLILAKKQRPVGFYLGLFALWYGAVRFFLDFFRIADVKYFGMTPAQYLSLVFVACGAWLLLILKRYPKRYGSYE